MYLKPHHLIGLVLWSQNVNFRLFDEGIYTAGTFQGQKIGSVYNFKYIQSAYKVRWTLDAMSWNFIFPEIVQEDLEKLTDEHVAISKRGFD